MSRHLGISLLLAVALVSPSMAGGLGTRSPSARKQGAVRLQSGTPGALRFHRPPKGYQDPGYRRSIGKTRSRVQRFKGEGYGTRAMREIGGYKVRDGLTLGMGRIYADRYDGARDRRAASAMGQRVGYQAGKIGNALRRIFQP